MIKDLLTILAITFATQTSYSQEADSRGFIVAIGYTAPNVKFNFIDGTKVSLKDYRGKVVMLQFTASWCGVCRKEMPFIENEIWQVHKDKDLIVIGIDRDEPLKKVKKFVKQMKTTYPMSLDPDAEIFAKFADKKSGVTRNVIIDRNGKIIFLTRLFNREEFDKMKEVIAELVLNH